MVETITGIMEQSDNQSILVVSHGAAIAQFFRQVLTDYPRVRMRNCAILTFTYENGNYDLLSIVDPVNKETLYQKEGSEKEKK